MGNFLSPPRRGFLLLHIDMRAGVGCSTGLQNVQELAWQQAML